MLIDNVFFSAEGTLDTDPLVGGGGNPGGDDDFRISVPDLDRLSGSIEPSRAHQQQGEKKRRNELFHDRLWRPAIKAGL